MRYKDAFKRELWGDFLWVLGIENISFLDNSIEFRGGLELRWKLSSEEGDLSLGFISECQTDIDVFSECWVDVMSIRWENSSQRHDEMWSSKDIFHPRTYTHNLTSDSAGRLYKRRKSFDLNPRFWGKFRLILGETPRSDW